MLVVNRCEDEGDQFSVRIVVNQHKKDLDKYSKYENVTIYSVFEYLGSRLHSCFKKFRQRLYEFYLTKFSKLSLKEISVDFHNLFISIETP